MKNLSLGIDIGGTNIVFGLVEQSGNVLFQNKIKMKDMPDAETTANEIYNLVLPILKENNLQGVGIGAPNGNFYTGCIENAPNLTWKGSVKLRDIFQKKFNAKTIVTNDANAAAYGEMIFGNAKGLKDFVVVTLGTGLGSGFVCNGNLLYGHDGFAGELGHTIIEPNGRQCGCGRKGCLETYVSATGILKTVKELLASGKISVLSQLPLDTISGEHISNAALQNDELALEAFDITAKYLGLALANTVAITSPETIFLYGGLARSGDLLLLPTKKYMEENMLFVFKNKINLKLSGLNSDMAVVQGPAALVWD
ncbi:MAG: ROK family protein [Bacteroidales bacterium]|nr:ROK family protein [Bacteroidales bacterium]